MFQIFETEDWVIAFVDVETTGLSPGYHEIIDVGVIIAEPDGAIIDSFHRRIMPAHPERTQPEAAECNGFSVKRWEETGAVSPSRAVEEMIDFYRKTAGDKNVMMSAYRSSFDAAFLHHLFCEVDKHTDMIHDYVLDLPSLAWGVGLQHLHSQDLTRELELADEPQHFNDDNPWEHTGLTGADKNLRIYKKLLIHYQQQRQPSAKV